MADPFFMDEVSALKQAVQEASRLREYSGEEMDGLVSEKIADRVEWARQNSPELYWYYQNLSFKERNILKYTVTESVEGLGILGKIIMDSDITEIMINGYDVIFVEKAGKLSRLEEHFENNEDLTRIVQRFVSSMDRTVDAGNPVVDARLEDGSRVHVALPPVALNGATVTIRRFPKNPMTVERLHTEPNSFSPPSFGPVPAPHSRFSHNSPQFSVTSRFRTFFRPETHIPKAESDHKVKNAPPQNMPFPFPAGVISVFPILPSSLPPSSQKLYDAFHFPSETSPSAPPVSVWQIGNSTTVPAQPPGLHPAWLFSPQAEKSPP